MEKGSLVAPLILILAVGVVGYLIINSQKAPLAAPPPNPGTSNGGWFNSLLQFGTKIATVYDHSQSSSGGGSSDGRSYSDAGNDLMAPNF